MNFFIAVYFVFCVIYKLQNGYGDSWVVTIFLGPRLLKIPKYDSFMYLITRNFYWLLSTTLLDSFLPQGKQTVCFSGEEMLSLKTKNIGCLP